MDGARRAHPALGCLADAAGNSVDIPTRAAVADDGAAVVSSALMAAAKTTVLPFPGIGFGAESEMLHPIDVECRGHVQRLKPACTIRFD